MRTIKSGIVAVLAMFLWVTAVPTSVRATAVSFLPEGNHARLNDDTFSTYETVTELSFSADRPIHTLYFLFRKQAVPFTVDNGQSSIRCEEGFLQYCVEVSSLEDTHLTVTFDEAVAISDVYAFGEGELPAFVHDWNAPHEKADLLLLSTHADDEHLFFAGVLPYYAGELGYRVQVAYLTDHINQPVRRQELLDGLWEVGVRHYPVIGEFPDRYSMSSKRAVERLEADGYTEEDIVDFQVTLLRRFRPLVVLGHDLNGEYGHGQHRLNSHNLIRAVELAADGAHLTHSTERYGTWNTPKLYLHLYQENTIAMDWDRPLSAFDGKTAFQVSQQGFDHHRSQHDTWFKTWLNGKNGDNTAAGSIQKYSPCFYGLYRSMVGQDEEKTDFFEHLLTYAEQEAWEAEKQAADTDTVAPEPQPSAAFPLTEVILGASLLLVIGLTAVLLKIC